jgi:DNA mismatch repair ATPase MutS
MTTPMMQQFREAKERYPGTMVFFRNGDFYELFEEDAEVGSRLLGITLTRRDKEIPMAGVPHHALDRYLNSCKPAIASPSASRWRIRAASRADLFAGK